MLAYYNDNDPFVCEWLRNLMAAGQITEGTVDCVDIEKVTPAAGFWHGRCHFFAGIGGWDLALDMAGWTGPVWTGSCPCQPFSHAGKRKGTDDERHLWPAWLRLITECRPPTIFGEQVSSRLGREWLAGVRTDLEALGYAVGASDLCAAGVSAPHIRQRLWWVADATAPGRRSSGSAGEKVPQPGEVERSAGLRRAGGLGNAEHQGSQGRWSERELPEGGRPGKARRPSGAGGLGNADEPERETRDGIAGGVEARPEQSDVPSGSRGLGNWDCFDIIPCADGKARRVEPGVHPLATGIPQRVGRLRAYGNSISPQVAATFIKAVMECS
jgi:DNA (cytosine-5)-methyltransferase 1